MYKKEKIMEVLNDIVATSKEIKPYVLIAQPRRDLNEMPAQNFDGYEGLHVDMLGYSHGFVHIGGEKVDVARNYLIEQALTSGAKYLFFIGEDTVVPYNAFLKLHETLENNPDSMAVGVYYIKLSSPMIMVRQDDYIKIANVDPGQLFEAWMSGLDCALIPIKLLQELKSDSPETPFCCIANKVGDIPFVGEDNFLVHRWHQKKWKILVNTDVQALHMDLASGKYTAHPSIKLEDYQTQIPITVPLTIKDKSYIDKRWLDRLPKGTGGTNLNKIDEAIKMGKQVKLNLGAGAGMQLEGYISIDKFDPSSDICMDVQELKLPENSVDEIFASHLLEHLNPHFIESTLSNWLKTLKPGGALVLELPNIEGLCKLFLDGDDKQKREITMYIHGAQNTTGTGDPRNITSPHLWGYYPKALREILTNVGFVDVEIKEQQFIHPGSNFRVEAKKGAI